MKRSLIMTTAACTATDRCTSLTQVISMQAHHVTKRDRSRGIVLIVGRTVMRPRRPWISGGVPVAAAVSAWKLVLLSRRPASR